MFLRFGIRFYALYFVALTEEYNETQNGIVYVTIIFMMFVLVNLPFAKTS